MRPRINERLKDATRFPVTLIVAPAGFGKSVALRDFIESQHLDAISYDVRREDATLLAFVRGLSEAFQPVAPGAIASFPSMQERVLAGEEPVRQISDWFAEHLKDVSCTVAIDDLHYAAVDQASIALLADVVERTGSRIRWIIAARSDVGLPVATWIAYGRMDVPIGEEDLRFTTDEALAAAADAYAELEPQEIESLRQLTEGWAVALVIALRTRTHASDLRTASSGTREMVYRYLAEQVFTALSLPQRAFALATCVFSSFDGTIAEALGATPQFLQEFRSKVTFLNELAPSQFRYHDLFRDFLEMELRRSGDAQWSRTLCEGARILETRGDEAGALLLFTRARSTDDLLRILERSGFSLFERGEGETLAAALEAVPETIRNSNSTALGLRALLEASRGRFDAADPFFRSAIALAEDTDLRLWLVHWYAIERVRRGLDCIALLEPYAFDEALPSRLRVPLLGTLATAYAGVSKSQMRTTISEALQFLDSSVSDQIRARLYQQASHCMYVDGDLERARSYAKLAADIAESHDLYEIAARAYYNLAWDVYDENDDPVELLDILAKVDECARKGGSTQARLFALVASYEVEVERGNDQRVEELDRLLLESSFVFPQGYQRAMLPARAMRAGWERDFRRAYALLSSEPAESTEERHARRLSEIAVYALAADFAAEGAAAIDEANAALQHTSKVTPRTLRTRLFLSIAELVRGHTTAAHHHLAGAEQHLPVRLVRLRALAQAIRAMYRVQLGQGDEGPVRDALSRLRQEHFGGIARLLEALPLSGIGGGTFSLLTAAEREILSQLAAGASTKDIARLTGRSPHTVDTHIRSICRKLNCSGRREAVALAVKVGWVQN